MSRVTVFKWERSEATGNKYEKVEDGVATFCTWGVDYETYDQGVGNFSTAIIKRPDGTIENIQAELVKFDPEQQP